MAAGDVVITAVIPLGVRKRAAYQMIVGTVTLDGGNPTPITLTNYLDAVDGAIVTMEGSGAPGADPNLLTHAISAAVVNVYAWKVTTGGAAGNPDLIASTNNARLAHFVAVGPTKSRMPV